MQASSRDWIFAAEETDLFRLSESIARHYLADETQTVRLLAGQVRISQRATERVMQQAKVLVENMRRNRAQLGGLDAFMNEYDLSSTEGIVLMCLAEALLRIPDAETADRLIADKLGEADFQSHLGTSESLFVNASTWALMLTGRIVHDDALERPGFAHVLGQTVTRLGEPVIRTAMRQAMRIMGHQFVMGRSIEDALNRAEREPAYRYSFDMLGEAALTAEDAIHHLDAYTNAIPLIGQASSSEDDLMQVPSVSVKLSALSPRFEFAQQQRAVNELSERLRTLAVIARDAHVAVTVDAEEADCLELTLEIFRRVFCARELADWPGLGIAVQSYQKRALYVVEWLENLAQSEGRVIPVRLMKGAYWDTEIKRAQEHGLTAYPVFTRKSSTDVSFLACAKRLLDAAPHLYPQFATHNAHSVAWLLNVGASRQFEFQRLHGMGEELYSELVGSDKLNRPCRIYAPVGSHEDLLPYLVRRLLENGANTSFVNRFVHDEASIDEIVEDPLVVTDALFDAGEDELPHPRIPLPRDLFGPQRNNSAGVNLTDTCELERLAKEMQETSKRRRCAAALVDGHAQDGIEVASRDPADWSHEVGAVKLASAETARLALDAASAFLPRWDKTPAAERAGTLRRAAEVFEIHRAELVALCVREAGRTVPDGLAELREAVDFLRYYADECERLFAAAVTLPGPTGERNTLRFSARGVFLCISPWNFPVAIFTGQVAAALAAGNTVLAKPAEQTSIVAGRVIELLHDAGVPTGALHYLPGKGPVIGEALLSDPRVAGVAFTGSTATAKRIENSLAQRDGPLAALIAETGGVNAMIVDSSALPEQVVRDAVYSAFNSAGQRCSALRLLCLQEETADEILRMLRGHMTELVIGDPALLKTDVGPVIDPDAKQMLRDYTTRRGSRVTYQCKLSDAQSAGLFFPPTLIELDRVLDLTHEVFGPVLHVVRYRAEDSDALVDELNVVGYGLTLGIHSRIDSFAQHVATRARVGNVYVNRNMIGAVVGVQPFGGMGLSGTGPKAGGPHYLPRFAYEQTLTVNTAAVGGNATLLTLAEE